MGMEGTHPDENGDLLVAKKKKDYAPRQPTDIEEHDILAAMARHTGCSIDELGGQTYIAIFDRYITDGPGFAGPVAVIIWGAGPEWVTSLKYDWEFSHWVFAAEMNDG